LFVAEPHATIASMSANCNSGRSIRHFSADAG